MEQPVDYDHLLELASKLDEWELLAKYLKIPNSQIEVIKSHGVGVQRIRMFEYWKQRCGSRATYKKMIVALLQINRTDLAEKVIRLSSIDAHKSPVTNNQTQASRGSSESSQAAIPTNSTGNKDTSSPDTVIPPLLAATRVPSVHTAQEDVISNRRELKEDFCKLVTLTEATLKNGEICLDTIIRHFSMIPQPIRRQHENYTATDKGFLALQQLKNYLTI